MDKKIKCSKVVSKTNYTDAMEGFLAVERMGLISIKDKKRLNNFLELVKLG